MSDMADMNAPQFSAHEHTGAVRYVAKGGAHVRLHYLDGLRGWAALAVVAYHATWELFKNYVPGIQEPPFSIIHNAKSAVFVFYVLSGVVLSYPFLASGNIESLKRSALRRYLRLTVPILAASFPALILMKSGLMFNAQASQIVHSDRWLGSFYQFTPSVLSWLQFSFYDVFVRYDVLTSYDVFLWTMPWELSGSFLVFALLALSGTSRATRIVWYVAMILVCTRDLQTMLSFVFGVMLSDLMTSAFYRRHSDHRLIPWIAPAAIGLAIIGLVVLRDSASARQCSVLAALIVFSVLLSQRAKAFLSMPVSQMLGRMSFPLYLCHSLVICAPASWLIVELAQRGFAPATVMAIVSPFVVVGSLIAGALFLPVEGYSIRITRKFSSLVLAGDRFVADRELRGEAPASSKGLRQNVHA